MALPLSKTEFRALSSDTRTSILKALQERNRTLSELSAKLGMSAPTIKEHAEILAESGMIELRDEGRKWKYYSLTQKGRDILESGKRQISIMLILSAVGVFILVGILAGVLPQVQLGASAPRLGAGTAAGDEGFHAGEEGEIAGAPAGTGIASKAGSGMKAVGSEPEGAGTPEGGEAGETQQPYKSLGDGNADSNAAGAGKVTGTEGPTLPGGGGSTSAAGQTGLPFKYDNPNCTPEFDVIVSESGTNVSEQYADYCYRSTTEEACRAVDYYNADSNSFGQGDGTPDCAWKRLAA